MKNGPTFGQGKICYIEIPSTNPQASADFFGKVFGWHIRKDNSGHPSFDDGVGEVSGMWVENRAPHQHAGIIISIMVNNATITSEAIIANGGSIIQPAAHDAPEKVALFKDPDGNIWSIYEHGK